jgi:hypothetical protein
MKFDSVLNAKADVFKNAFGYREVVGAQTEGGGSVTYLPSEDSDAFKAMVAGKREGKRDPRELIAIGVIQPQGHNRDPSSYEIAILVQQKRLLQHPIVEQARRAAKGEAQVILTGPAMRHGALAPGRYRPLRIGISVGHYRVTAGTLGCFVRCRYNGGVGILSANHVLANCDRSENGDIILQPARADGGIVPDDIVARLYRHVPLSFRVGTSNAVDCAFAMLNDKIEYEVSTIYDPPGVNFALGSVEDLVVDQLDVKKFGRTTGRTSGVITAVNVDNVYVNMIPSDSTKVARFDDQIAISGKGSAFSKPGDSGSIVFSDNDDLVGLLFAGTDRGGADGGGIAYANPISKVLDLLEVDIVRS